MTRCFLVALALPLLAQPKVEHAKLETRAVSGSLEATFRTLVSSSTDPGWIGYSVSQVPGERSMCGTVSLEGAREVVVLYRAVAGQVEKIRTYPVDCTFDAGDLPMHWLTGVDGSQSALLLESFIPATLTNERRGTEWQLANSALSAIARHLDGAPALIDLAHRTQIPPQIRQEAVRWLGRSKDPRATRFFEELLKTR